MEWKRCIDSVYQYDFSVGEASLILEELLSLSSYPSLEYVIANMKVICITFYSLLM